MPRLNTRKPPSEAPRILTSLLATRAAADRKDQLGDPAAAAAWLADQGLSSASLEVTQADWRRLLDLREGLHALIPARGRRWTKESASRFSRTIRGALLEVSVTSDRTVRFASSERSFAGAFGTIVSLVVHSHFADQWKRFKTCANDECLQVFYDESRTCNRRWCGERCGDLIRTRRHRSAKRHGRR